jgi:hypothetical protein
MKKKNLKNGMMKLGVVLSFVFLSSAAVALGNEGDKNMPTGLPAEGTKAGKAGIIETQRTIKQHISFPNIILLIAKTEKVEVVFTTDEKGKVNFVTAKTENELLKNQIEKQFLEMTLSKIKSNVAYSIVFNIKKI